MTGYPVHDHLAAFTFFNIFFPESIVGKVQVFGHRGDFSYGDIDHKIFATSSA